MKSLIFRYLLIGYSLLFLFSCKTLQTSSALKHVNTADSKGNVYLLIGGGDLVTIRKCPKFTAFAESEQWVTSNENNINTKCPRTETNQKVFRQSAVRDIIKDFYSNVYIVEDKPVDEDLQAEKTRIDTETGKFREANISKRQEIENNINELIAYIQAVNSYQHSNKNLLEESVINDLHDKETELKQHKKELLGLSDEQITSALNIKKAESWSKAFAEFMDKHLFKKILDETKNHKISASNPLGQRLVSAITSLWEQNNGYLTRLTRFNEGRNHDEVDVLNSTVMPDGRILYTTDRSRNGLFELWMMDPKDPENPVQLTSYDDGEVHQNVNVYRAEVMPDGRIILMADRNIETSHELWIMDPNDPKKQVQLTRYDDGSVHERVSSDFPVVIPDGRIIYNTNRSKASSKELWLMDPKNPKNPIQLTRYDDGGVNKSVFSYNPTFVSEGRIVYLTDRSKVDAFELWMMDLKDPKNPVQLTRHDDGGIHSDVDASRLTVMPDGKVLYSTDRSKDDTFELWMMDLKDPKNPLQLTRHDDGGIHSDVDVSESTVMPDGKILYTTDRSEDGVFELWMMDLKDPKNPVQLTRHDDGGTHDKVGVSEPTIMPDGRIIYRTDRSKDGVYELWMMDPLLKDK